MRLLTTLMFTSWVTIACMRTSIMTSLVMFINAWTMTSVETSILISMMLPWINKSVKTST